jgi:phosphoglycerate dehydrogenase-like enzyme
MESWQVIRTHSSPYQKKDYSEREQKALESLPGISYISPNKAITGKSTILITNTHTHLSKISPEILNSTKLIIHPNSGYDNFTADYNLWKSIPLVVGHTIRAQAVAEYMIGCLFEAVLDLPKHEQWSVERNWNRRLLKDMSIWIFGYGHIGKKVAATLAALGANITIVDPFITGCPYHWLKTWQDGDIHGAHAVLSCMSLNTTSRNLYNHSFFSKVNSEIIFINAARGDLVDEQALRIFANKSSAKFYLDVFAKEPFHEEWQEQTQICKTSHIAGVHKELEDGILEFTFQTLKDFLELSKIDFSLKYQQEILQNKWRDGVLI